ncbi:MAG TPA: epimerase [Petrimonas sp.]|nr:epimerase [Petrimonas sp.]
MDVLLLGGTGAMGEYLSDIHSRKGDNVFVTTRSYREPKENLNFILGNAKDLDFLKSVLNKRWDAIVDFMVYSTIQFQERVDFLLNATNQYVFLSSARVYADSEKPIVENSSRLLDCSDDVEFLKTDEYSLTKARQEDILRKSKKTNWTIIRPYITFSPQRLQLGILEKEDWLYRALKGRTIVFSEDINSKLTTLTIGFDVAKTISVLIGEKEAYGEVFHITTEEPIKWSEILNLYLDILENYLGERPKVKLENKENYLKNSLAKYQIQYDRFFNRQFDNSKVGKYIQLDSFVETKLGLTLCLNQFLSNPQFKTINWGAEAIKDRKTNEFSSLSEIKNTKQKMKYLIYRYIKKS